MDDEIRRNRETKLAEAFSALRKLKLPSGIPEIARNLPEFADFLGARRELDAQRNTLDQRLTEQVDRHELAADRVLEELMTAADTIPIDDGVLEAARRRVDLGNPPGKRGSLGDAVNWEALLRSVPDVQDLYLVTSDGDFVSKLDKERASEFLRNEWRTRKHADVYLYRRISGLFGDKFPDIKLASEFEKELRIRRLLRSDSFDETHRAIAALAGYTDFSEQQAKDLLEGAPWNSQIAWIAHDDDVEEFFDSLFDRHGHLLEPEDADRFRRAFFEDISDWEDIDY
jgi:hypothetical protein